MHLFFSLKIFLKGENNAGLSTYRRKKTRIPTGGVKSLTNLEKRQTNLGAGP